jgi:uncharacterized protein (DUF302 family)
MKKLLLLLALSATLFAQNVYVKKFDVPMGVVEKNLEKAFSSNNLIVISQIDILEKFKAAGLEKTFGKDFNTNQLTGIKAMIICNGGFGNAVANADPEMMGFCPVRITITEKDGKTSVTYVKSSAPESSKAYEILQKLDEAVIASIENAK